MVPEVEAEAVVIAMVMSDRRAIESEMVLATDFAEDKITNVKHMHVYKQKPLQTLTMNNNNSRMASSFFPNQW